MAYTLKNGQKAIVRQAVTEDIPFLKEAIKAYVLESPYQVLTIEEFEDTFADYQYRIISRDHMAGSVIFVADVEGMIVGNIDFTPNNRKRLAHSGNIGMGIMANWRNIGLGSAMLDTLIKWAKKNRSIEKLCLQVYADNAAAIRLYEKFDFREDGRQKQFIKLGKNKYEDNVLMSRPV